MTSQPDFVDGVDEPTGKGTSRVGPGWSGTAPASRAAVGVGAAQVAARPGLGVSADDVPDLGCCWSGRWRAGRR